MCIMYQKLSVIITTWYLLTTLTYMICITSNMSIVTPPPPRGHLQRIKYVQLGRTWKRGQGSAVSQHAKTMPGERLSGVTHRKGRGRRGQPAAHVKLGGCKLVCMGDCHHQGKWGSGVPLNGSHCQHTCLRIVEARVYNSLVCASSYSLSCQPAPEN